jgi:hypothetical protein
VVLLSLTGCTPHFHLFGHYETLPNGTAVSRPAESQPAEKTVEDIVKENL